VDDGLPDAGVTRRDAGTPPRRDAGQEPDGGTTPGDGERQLRTTFHVPWIQRDPSDPSRLLFAEQQESGSVLTVDRVRAVDLTEPRILPGNVYDLSTLQSSACRADSIVVPGVNDETWINCDLAPGLRVIF